jgi:hypothetical protein
MPDKMSPSLLAGCFYFAFVFAAGFVLGTIRVVAIVPIVGARTAELLELPIMIVISFLAARWIIRRLAIGPRFSARAAMGVTAIVFLLGAEFGFVLWLRGISLAEYFETRDPLTGTMYYLSLIVFAAMPLLLMKFGGREGP